MEPIIRPETNRSQFQQNRQPEANQTAPKAPSKIMKLKRFIKKRWYLCLIGAVVLTIGIVFLFIKTSQETSWKKATDYYAKADYAKVESEIGGMGMPTDVDRLRIYAQTMLATRNFDKALPAYEKLCELKKDPSDQLMLGNVYNEKKDYTNAIRVYTDIINSNPSNIQAYTNIATLYKLQGNTAQAIKTANECVTKNPTSIQGYELLVGMLMDDKTKPEYKAAVESLRKLNPNDLLFE